MRRPRLKLVQLPVPPPAAYASTGNVPLAAGALAVAARQHGLTEHMDVDLVDPSTTDGAGDARLADLVAEGEPDFVGLSLYLWNTERSLHLAREVKRRSPATTILVGGPEVGPDNPFVLRSDGYDVAVTGEAEAIFASMLTRLLGRKSLDGHPGVAIRRNGHTGPFGPEAPASFPLTDYPSPYVAGVLPVSKDRVTYVETVRGCKSACTFCFYPRSSNVLRALSPAESGELVSGLALRGASEVVFLDPTFNHRPEFRAFLEAIRRANASRALSFFAEIRAEGLSAADADLLAEANFTKVEIGLQSVNPKTLARTKRGGSPAKVAEAARLLHARGIRLLVDLIIGLPGDTAEDVARGVDFLLEHGLGDEAQVFPLAVLPGTAMRADAASDGLVFEDVPPYRIRRTETMGEDDLLGALLDAEERLGRRLDETPRPHLVGRTGLPDPPDRFDVDLAAPPAASATPGAQHAALWLSGDPWRSWNQAAAAILARIAVDPHSRLDVVFGARAPFPHDVLDRTRAIFGAAPLSYRSRSLALRGEDGQRQMTIVIEPGAKLPRDWIDAARDGAHVFEEMSLDQALARAQALGDELPGALVTDPEVLVGGASWRALLDSADPHSVAFSCRDAEQEWTRQAVLG